MSHSHPPTFIPSRLLFTISIEPLDVPRVTLVRIIWQLLTNFYVLDVLKYILSYSAQVIFHAYT